MIIKNYDSFISSIDYLFGDREDIKNKTFLSNIMRKRGFFNAKNPNKKVRQANKLTTKAWIHLKYTPSQLDVVMPRGFKRRQIRDKRTGRILGWE